MQEKVASVDSYATALKLSGEMLGLMQTFVEAGDTAYGAVAIELRRLTLHCAERAFGKPMAEFVAEDYVDVGQQLDEALQGEEV